MPERAEIKQVAREKLGGALAPLCFREFGMLAGLLRGPERIEAMALSRLRGHGLVASQRLVVATSERLLLVEKGLVTGRERLREAPWPHVRGASIRPPGSLDVQLRDGEVIELSLVQPADQLAALGDAIRQRTSPDVPAARTSFGELRELTRRKLGRMLALGSESLVLALADELGDREAVLDLAYAQEKPEGLLVVTSDRLLFLPARGIRVGPVVSVAFEDVSGVTVEGDRLTVTGSAAEIRVDGLAPQGRAAAIATRARARAGA